MGELVESQKQQLSKGERTLSRLASICAELPKLNKPEDAKKVTDYAAAIQRATQKAGLEQDIQNEAARCVIRTRHRMGELLAEMPKATGSQGKIQEHTGGCSVQPPVDAPPTLAEMGIEKTESHRAQLLASVPIDHLELLMADLEKSGEITQAGLLKELKRENVNIKIDEIGSRSVKPVTGCYEVVVIDPPWPIGWIYRDVRPNQAGLDYPTMSEEELAALTIPCAEDCHVWLWTTHKFLPMALRLLDAWSLNYVCTFVWHKPGGFQPIGLPQYNCEFALYARRGAPKFTDTKALPVCFNADRGAHSEKPEPFYETVRRVTAGRRLDMFNRRSIEGFDSWGQEAAA